jgi:lincosamide nucleotidyltransferase B/F
MNIEEYRSFTRELQNRLIADARVLGLVAVGSMSEQGTVPDQWSDHDFFVVVQSGFQEEFRKNLSWLPRSESILFHFRETAHGLKVIYSDAHLLEFAVFDLQELHLAKVNRYRVIFDRGSIESEMQKVAEATQTWNRSVSSDDRYLIGQFLTNILVGFGRYQRGERLSGQQFIKNSALKYLVLLLGKHVPSETKSVLDGLDPFRRFEVAYPELGKRLNACCNEYVPVATDQLLDLAEQALLTRLPEFPQEAFQAVRKYIRENDWGFEIGG